MKLFYAMSAAKESKHRRSQDVLACKGVHRREIKFELWTSRGSKQNKHLSHKMVSSLPLSIFFSQDDAASV